MLYRAPHLSREEFVEYWQNKHAPLALEHAASMKMKRYVQNHRVDHVVAESSRQSRGCVMGDFDGVAEACWNSFDEMLAGGGDTPEEVARAILEDEAQFVDLQRSIIWFAEEKPILSES
nr:EthD domain-containing protein [Halioglobus maricola]